MNKYLKSGFTLTGIFLGVLMIWQFRTEKPSSGIFLADELEARELLFNDYLADQAYFQSRIVALREDIEEAQEAINTQREQSSLDLLDDLKKEIGLTEIRGRGLEITLDDSPFAIRAGIDVADSYLVQASDIRDVVNILNASNVDGISVNGQRVIATTPIKSVGETLLVNNSYMAPPFVITAVGDAEIMLQRLLNQNLLPSIYERSSKSQIIFKIAVKETTTVPVYNGDLKTNHLTLVE